MKTWLTRSIIAVLLLGCGYGAASAVQAYQAELAYAQQQKHLRDCCGFSEIGTEVVFAVAVGLGDGMSKDSLAKLDWDEKNALASSWRAMASFSSQETYHSKFNAVFQEAGRKTLNLLAKANISEADFDDLLEAIATHRHNGGGMLSAKHEKQLLSLFDYRQALAVEALNALAEVNKLYIDAGMKATHVLGKYPAPKRGIAAVAVSAVKVLHPELFGPARPQ